MTLVFDMRLLDRIAPRAHPTYREAFARVDHLEAAGMLERPRRLAHFLAQCCHETGGLRVLSETLRYTADRLMAVWPTRFRTRERALMFAGRPEALANEVYGGRMGNVEPGDGWRFRGRGLLQITGRENYTRVGQAIGVDLVAHPDLAASADYALPVALEIWRAAGCHVAADADDLVRVTRAINGGVIGIEDRRGWLMRIKAVLGAE